MEQQLPSLEVTATFEGLQGNDFSALTAAAERQLKALMDVAGSVEGSALEAMAVAYRKLKAEKPLDRSEKARYYAICITKLQEAMSCYYAMIEVELFNEDEEA